MLKSVSSITNAIGALNFKGTWDANANSPALASSVGTKGDYYVVGTAGSTNLNGISNWGVGDLATFNGSVWQRVEGGADLNGVNLSVSGTSTLSGLTASTALALNASKEVVSVTNTGTGNNVLATAPTLVGDVTLSTGNAIQGTAAKGINFTANTPAAGMTSQLLNWYEEGTWTPTLTPAGGTITTGVNTAGSYTRIGRQVTAIGLVDVASVATPTGALSITGLPFTCAAGNESRTAASIYATGLAATSTTSIVGRVIEGETKIRVDKYVAGNVGNIAPDVSASTLFHICVTYFV